MKWLNEEFEEYENNSYYSAVCSNCQCIATFCGSVSKYYEFCPFCGEPTEKEVDKMTIEKLIKEIEKAHNTCVNQANCSNCPYYDINKPDYMYCSFLQMPLEWDLHIITDTINTLIIRGENK